MSETVAAAGSMGYVVLGLGFLGILLALAAGGMAATKRRVPLAGLVVVPYFILAVGAFGAWAGTSSVHEALGSATPFNAPIVALTETWNAMSVDWLARVVAAVLLIANVWAAAMGSAVGAGESRFTPAAVAGSAFFTLLGVAATGAMISRAGLDSAAYLLPVALLVGGLGVVAAATRRGVDDGMWRVAGMRFAAAASLVLAVYHAGRAVDIGNRMSVLGGDAAIVKMTDLAKAVELYNGSIELAFNASVVALAFSFLIAACGFLGEISEVAHRRTVFDAFAAVAVMVVVGGVRLMSLLGFNGVYALSTNHPVIEMFHEYGTELAAAAVTRGDDVLQFRYYEGGFGDVLHFDGKGWVRHFAWNGTDWVEDHTELAAATLSDRPPLLVIGRTVKSDELLPVLEKAGTAWLMLKGSNAPAGTFVPTELARLQVTMLPISLATTPDWKSELWIAAGGLEVQWGPTSWYGEKDDSLDPFEYAGAALAATQSPGINVLAKGRNVGDLVATCAPYVVEQADDRLAPPATERWCRVSMEEFDAVRTAAAGLWEHPTAQNLTATIKTQGPLDLAEVEDRIKREIGGLGYCGELAEKAGDPVEGVMTLQLAVAKDGDVYDTLVDEKSKLQSPTILRCAAKRFRRLAFTMPEPVEEPEDAAPKKGPPPEPPRVLLALEYKPMPAPEAAPAE